MSAPEAVDYLPEDADLLTLEADVIPEPGFEERAALPDAPVIQSIGHQVVAPVAEEGSDLGCLPGGRLRTRPPLSYRDVNEFSSSYRVWLRSTPEVREEFSWPVPIDSETFFDLYDKDRTTLRRRFQDTDNFSQQFMIAASRSLSPADQHEIVEYLLQAAEPKDLSIVITHLQCSRDFILSGPETDELLDYHDGYYSAEILGMLDKVTITDVNKFTLSLLESDDWWDNPAIEKYLLAHLGDIDHKAATDRMIYAGKYGVEYLIDVMEYFDDIDETWLMKQVLDSNDGTTKLHQNLYKFHHVPDEVLQRLSTAAGYPVTAYPHGASEKARNRWFAENAYTYLEGGFSKDMIGKVIRLRTEPRFEVKGGRRTALLPIAHNLHDASQWLTEFSLPVEAYDLTHIRSHRNDPDFDPENLETRRLRDDKLEYQLITAIMQLPLEVRKSINLSSKPEAVLQLFGDSMKQQVYFTLTQPDATGEPLYKSPDLSWELLHNRVYDSDETYRHQFTEQGHVKRDITTRRYQSTMRAWNNSAANLETRFRAGAHQDGPVNSVRIRNIIAELKGLGLRRKAYADDTATWLLRHATSPSSLLTKVWGDRPLALASGFRDDDDTKTADVQDKASDIKKWQTAEGTRLVLRQPEVQARLAEVGLSKNDITGPNGKAWREELTRKLSADRTVEAFIKYQKWTKGAPKPKLLAPAVYETGFDGSLGRPAWRFELLAPDDPRGFTIGPDTGCCMTINGASKDCIKAGYTRPNAGFVALYGPDGKVNAQSFWYINPEHPDTLVLDNIEANRGRNFQNITSVYVDALDSILTDHNAAHPQQPITRVHVGEGYTDVKIGHLPQAVPVPKLSPGIYSDAKKQRLLLTI